ncbi:MAG: hypothetical protein P1U83_16055 [Roseovarius sp.]|nr:hypothetical protein [Roseovarius sp.]
MTHPKTSLISCLAVLSGFLFTSPVMATDELEFKDSILIELNATQSTDEACTFTFQIINGYTSDIQKAVYEAVLFDSNGTVNRLTLFDFGSLPAGRPRVRQFVMQGTKCNGLSRVLINGAHACEVADLEKSACEKGLQVMSRSDIEVTG